MAGVFFTMGRVLNALSITAVALEKGAMAAASSIEISEEDEKSYSEYVERSIMRDFQLREKIKALRKSQKTTS